MKACLLLSQFAMLMPPWHCRTRVHTRRLCRCRAETWVWVQLALALRAVHLAGLACRPGILASTKVLVTSPGRIRLGALAPA